MHTLTWTEAVDLTEHFGGS